MRIAEDRCSLTRLLWRAAVAALRACAAATRSSRLASFCGSKSKVFGQIAVRRDVRRVGERGYPGRAKRDERGRAILHEENASNSTKPGAKHASTPVAVDARGGDKRAEGNTNASSHLLGDGLALRLLTSLEARCDGRERCAAVAGVHRHLDDDGARGRGHGGSRVGSGPAWE